MFTVQETTISSVPDTSGDSIQATLNIIYDRHY